MPRRYSTTSCVTRERQDEFAAESYARAIAAACSSDENRPHPTPASIAAPRLLSAGTSSRR